MLTEEQKAEAESAGRGWGIREAKSTGPKKWTSGATQRLPVGADPAEWGATVVKAAIDAYNAEFGRAGADEEPTP